MGKQRRPLVAEKNDEELDAYIRESLDKREPFYNQAQETFNISLLDNGKRIDEAVQMLKEAIEEKSNY
jgi:shikimate kinase